MVCPTTLWQRAGMSKKNSPPKTFEEIDRNLRLVYEEFLEEEIPDRFNALLAKLKQNEGTSETGDE